MWAEGHEEPPKPAAEEIAAAGGASSLANDILGDFPHNIAAPARTPEEILRHEEAENAQGRNTANTLFVKNLSFETTENSLQQFFRYYVPLLSWFFVLIRLRGTGEVRNVTIAKKRDMKNKGSQSFKSLHRITNGILGKILSMGYGFVEFKTRDDALSAFRLKQVLCREYISLSC